MNSALVITDPLLIRPPLTGLDTGSLQLFLQLSQVFGLNQGLDASVLRLDAAGFPLLACAVGVAPAPVLKAMLHCCLMLSGGLLTHALPLLLGFSGVSLRIADHCHEIGSSPRLEQALQASGVTGIQWSCGRTARAAAAE